MLQCDKQCYAKKQYEMSLNFLKLQLAINVRHSLDMLQTQYIHINSAYYILLMHNYSYDWYVLDTMQHIQDHMMDIRLPSQYDLAFDSKSKLATLLSPSPRQLSWQSGRLQRNSADISRSLVRIRFEGVFSLNLL